MPFGNLKLDEVNDFFADDYGNIYLYKNNNFSFTKYDSLANQKAKLMLTLPFRIQSVQNPLTLTSFSENAQELKFFDYNLSEIQTINFGQKFGFIKFAYVEDLQQTWLLDESMKRLIQYNYREGRVINSLAVDRVFEGIIDLLVFDKKIYFLYQNKVIICNFKSEKIAEFDLINGKKIRRENNQILVVSKNAIQKIEQSALKTIFAVDNAQIVDKNSASYFVIKENKLYLYPIEKEGIIK